MLTIDSVRTVLLSSPYSFAEDAEIKECFPNGPKRTVGMVEVTLSNGITGLGEGYLAVFAPLVFREIVNLCTPYILGQNASDIGKRISDLRSVCDYWSLQGAARHVISAFDIALHDAMAKTRGIPLYEFLGGPRVDSIPIYGSGGCCDTKEHFLDELALLDSMGISIYKMRSVKEDINRTIWVLDEAGRRGITVGVDMCQNLADPPQLVDEVVRFIDSVHARTPYRIRFVEEAIGPDCPEGFRELRQRTDVPVCGGEIITTPKEMIERLNGGVYDFVQPDASVIGGVGAVLSVFEAARKKDIDVVVHAWGGAVAIMANYHVAFAAGGKLVEFPMLTFPLGNDMVNGQYTIRDGKLFPPDLPGIGVRLTPEMEAMYPFEESAVYSCKIQEFQRKCDDYWL